MKRRQTSLPQDLEFSEEAPSSAHGFGDPQIQKYRGGKPPKQKGPKKPPVHTTAGLTRFSSSRVFTQSGNEKILIANNRKRKYLMIQNVGTVEILLGFSGSVKNGIELPAGAQLDFSSGYVPFNEIKAFSIGDGELAVLEGSTV